MLSPDLILQFWLPCTIVHLIVFIIANKNDININLPTFYLGHLISWIIVSLATYFLEGSQSTLWIFYIVYILIISTIFSDIFLQQESFSLSPFGHFLKENIIESILWPWGVALSVGFIILYLI